MILLVSDEVFLNGTDTSILYHQRDFVLSSERKTS